MPRALSLLLVLCGAVSAQTKWPADYSAWPKGQTPALLYVCADDLATCGYVSWDAVMAPLLDALKGAGQKGDPGPAGAIGPRGIPGPMGPQGLPGSGSGGASNDFAPSLAGGTITVQPGKMRFDTTPCDLNRASISSNGSGTGNAKLFIANSCAAVLLFPSSLSVTFSKDGITAGAAALPVFPPGSFPIADVVIRDGSIESITDLHRAISVDAHIAGPGLVIDCTTGPCLFSIDPATVPTIKP